MGRLPYRSRELAALYEASLAITAELSLDKVLEKIVHVARDLVAARYAALGVRGEDGLLAYFVTAGLPADEVARIEERPRGRGLLGLLLQRTQPLRIADLASHPASSGFPPGHPAMTSFLGAPLVHRGRVVGSLYLTDKIGVQEFSVEDETLIEMLAAQAAVAVENARLFALTDDALRRKVDELQAERRNLKAIVDQLPEGVAIVDATAEKVVLLNRAALKLLGAGKELDTAPNSTLATCHPVYSDGRPVPREETATYRAVIKGEVVSGEQMCLQRADGSRVNVLANAAPLYGPVGGVVGGIVVFQDVTALRELDRMKDELVSIISHELRNPLTAIRGRAQLMLRTARKIPERVDDVVGLQAIDQQVGKLAEMVRELLDVSQMRLGLMDLRRQPVDLVALARQTLDEIQPTDDKHSFRLESTLGTLIGNWDGPRLEQVLFNMLENAQKYSPEGGTITLRIAEQSGSIDRLVPRDRPFERPKAADGTRSWAVVAVSDQGIGIPKEAVAHLFDRFYRAANAKGRAETGLGLGLYICNEIVAQHGGAIWLESEEGHGTTFYFALPL